MKVLKPPTRIDDALFRDKYSVFLAGSIEMGEASNWQQEIESALAGVNCVVFNPRRDDWDSSWAQSIDNAQFRNQVEWELTALEKADLIAMYFDPLTKSPVSLLELGLFARSGKMLVCCPDGFWRKGNVDIVCHNYMVGSPPNLARLIQRVVEEARLGKNRPVAS